MILLGQPGVGKTHLAISLAIAAAEAGRRVYYGTLAGLIESLTEAKAAGNLSRRLRVLTHPALLVVDEIGYLPVNQDGAVLFFQLINARHEKASTVLTSNKGFENWGGVLSDEVMAAALIDRLVHHCHIVNIRGNSYRMRDHQTLLQASSDRRRHLDGIEVGAGGSQKAQLGAGALDGMTHCEGLVGGQVVHDDDVTGGQCWHQHLLHIGQEGRAVHGAVEHSGRGHAVQPKRTDEGGGLPMTMRHRGTAPLAAPGHSAAPFWSRRWFRRSRPVAPASGPAGPRTRRGAVAERQGAAARWPPRRSSRRQIVLCATTRPWAV